MVFDFSKNLSTEAYQGLQKKVTDLDISILVNNVGISSIGAYHTINPSDLMDEIAVNCYPIVLLTQAFLKPLEDRVNKLVDGKKYHSLIVNLSSSASLQPLPYFSNYAATKVFDDAFSKGIYYELRAKGVDVLSVQP